MATPIDYDRGIKCGNGHRHATVAEVKACFGIAATGTPAPTSTAPAVAPSPPQPTPTDHTKVCGAWHDTPVEVQVCVAVRKQWGLADVGDQTPAPPAPIAAQAYVNAVQPGVQAHTQQAAPAVEKEPWFDELQVPVARYAVMTAGGLKFIKVRENTQPKYRRYRKVILMSSDNEVFIKDWREKKALLEQVIKQGFDFSKKLYGKHIGECGECGRTLTSEWRDIGIGPDCYQKLYGKGASPFK